MKELSKQNIIITKPNKDESFVIMDAKDYVKEKDFIKETEWQLNKNDNYKRFQQNVTTTNMK